MLYTNEPTVVNASTFNGQRWLTATTRAEQNVPHANVTFVGIRVPASDKISVSIGFRLCRIYGVNKACLVPAPSS